MFFHKDGFAMKRGIRMKCDILIAGVGGQGQVLASRLLGAAAIDAGLSVRTSETIGMSQRGGCVTSSVRIGGSTLSAAVPQGQADLIIGFEICETARNLDRLGENGGVVLNTRAISPVSVSLGQAKYDKDKMLDYIKSNAEKFIAIDALKSAEEAGSVKAVNVIMLGAACAAGLLPFEREQLISVILSNVSAKFRSINEKAFTLGFTAGSSR